MKCSLLDRYFGFISNCIYFFSSIALVLCALLLIMYSSHSVWVAIANRVGVSGSILDAVSLIIIAIAVFDVGKYLLEEEVCRDRELRRPAEARQTLTKFIVIIAIAISLEALVTIFGAAKQDISLLIYPSALVITVTFLIVGLGLYQKMSVNAEEKVEGHK